MFKIRAKRSGSVGRLMQSTVLCIAAAVLALSAGRADAQIAGPDGFGYRAFEVTSPFEDISGTGTRILDGDDDSLVGPFNMGFNFSFYGNSHSNISISTNGYTELNSPFGYIVPWGNDWVAFDFLDPTDAVYYETLGLAGSQRFIVQWNELRGFATSPSTVTFQMALFEGSNDILFRYKDIDSGDGRRGSVYIQNDTHFLLVNNSLINDGDAILLTTGSPSAVTPEPGTMSLLGAGVLGLFGKLRRRKQTA